MSRERVHEVSSPISLFPFIGILLCTMGALLVVLVAVSRSARDTAEEQVHKKQHAAKSAEDDGSKKKLAYVQEYVGALTTIRSEAERKLRDEHAKLSHVEDHIRRLQERLRALQAAGAELMELEKEHYDDREQAERETERLNELIQDSRKQIEALQDAADREPTSYALVPYEGPNGTFRRPIYIECVKEGIVLQPEGVRITPEDLRSPIGAGNPLAAALRASRDHLVKLYPNEGKGRDTEPYPLLIVRPEGLFMFDRARQAIEAGDFDLGFELVEADWKLKYPQSDPQLAAVEEQAITIARARQEVLAAAAPRAYRGGSHSFDEERGADDDEFGSGPGGGGGGGDFGGGGSGGGGYAGGEVGYSGGGGGGGGGSPEGYAAGGSGGGGEGYGPGSSGYGAGDGGSDGLAGVPSGNSAGSSGMSGSGGAGEGLAGGSGGGTYGGSGGGGGSSTGDSGGGMGDAGDGNFGGSPGGFGGGGGEPGAGGGSPGGTMAGRGSAGGMSGGSGAQLMEPSDNLPPDTDQASRNPSVMMGVSSPPVPDQASAFDRNGQRGQDQTVPPEQRGNDWAMRQKPQRSVPVRRAIRVIVRQDQLAILPDTAKTPTASNSRVVPMKGDTVQAVDQFVKQVHAQIDGWGIAGNGLYWRPVIILTVGPDGQKRADDLARLLKNSGLELRTNETATNVPQGTPHETR